MDIDLAHYERFHHLRDSATHPRAPRSGRHAALLGLAGKGLPRSHALPDTQITAPSGAFNCGF